MSFRDYITEIRASELELERVLYLIKRDCKPYLKRVKGAKDFLWRGIDSRMDDITKIVPRKNREPKDTPQGIHDLYDLLFKQRFGWSARSEGVFCYAKESSTAGYGEAYMIFPIGDNWGFLWNKNINDLYSKTKEEWEYGSEPDEDEYYQNYGEESGQYGGDWSFEGHDANDIMELAADIAEEDRYQCESDAEFECGEEPSKEQGELFSGEFGNREGWLDCQENFVEDCMREHIDFNYDRIESDRVWEPKMTWEEFVDEWQSEHGEECLENSLADTVKGYSDKGFKKAIMTNNEIMIHCDAYYAVAKKLKVPLKKEFLEGKVVFDPRRGLDVEAIRKTKVKVRKL